MSWLRRNPHLLAYVLVIAVAVVGMFAIRSEGVHRRQALCREVNAMKIIVDDLIEVATAGGGSFDPTRVPGWDELEPQDKVFWQNIARGLASSDGSSSTEDRLREFARTRLNPTDCEP